VSAAAGNGALRIVMAVLLICAVSGAAMAAEDRLVRIGSKNFNENYLLAEMSAQMLEQAGVSVERRFGLGGTLICYEALRTGEIDLYIEYTGTLSQAILSDPEATSVDALNDRLVEFGLTVLPAFGFNNTYAMVIKQQLAEDLGMRTIADIASQTQLKVVVSHEFLEREDGWPGLARAYGLSGLVTGIEHGLAYQALADGAIDITDAYSTDGELKRYDLQVLEDNRGFFPQYLAVPLIRDDLPLTARRALERLAGSIDDQTMQILNAEVVFKNRSFAEVANGFLVEQGFADEVDLSGTFWGPLLDNTAQHLKLTGIALLGSILVGVGASLLVFRIPVLARSLTYFCGLLQTVPSIALLALMIPLFGIGMLPAIIALFLYSLLPILRNTLTALTTIDPTLVRVAVAIGLKDSEQLRLIYLPLALPAMFAGIRTAAVISIGTATLAAFIGAGGLGDPIVTGLALNDVNLILQGAVPAAGLAMLTELVFEGLERLLLPGNLRLANHSVSR
jgi:osmoprotectant transport system permease protein